MSVKDNEAISRAPQPGKLYYSTEPGTHFKEKRKRPNTLPTSSLRWSRGKQAVKYAPLQNEADSTGNLYKPVYVIYTVTCHVHSDYLVFQKRLLRGVSNSPIQFESARKIWPLLELLTKIR